jgi:hypothetical protein
MMFDDLAPRRMRDRTVCLIGSGVSGKRNEDGGAPHLTKMSLEDQ